jgi:hypothetical protein
MIANISSVAPAGFFIIMPPDRSVSWVQENDNTNIRDNK